MGLYSWSNNWYYIVALCRAQKGKEMKYYAIFDKKSGAYMETMFPARNTAEAIRSVQTTVNDPKTNLYLYPADFQLYLIGDYDPLRGIMEPATPQGPFLVIEVAALVNPNTNKEMQ